MEGQRSTSAAGASGNGRRKMTIMSGRYANSPGAIERLTMAQALIRYLTKQYVSRDGKEYIFFAGVWGIFGHGNVAGVGQALQQYRSEMRYYQSRNEQAQVHAAIAYAKQKNRLQTFACTSSIGPGA